jgi:hypothetical protein
MHGEEERCIGSFRGKNMKERVQLEAFDVDGGQC